MKDLINSLEKEINQRVLIAKTDQDQEVINELREVKNMVQACVEPDVENLFKDIYYF